MNITKTELKNEQNLESVDEVTPAQKPLSYSRIEDSFLYSVEATKISRSFQLLEAGRDSSRGGKAS